jgi:UDP-N-acetylmuramate dehydrogenase
MKFLEDVSLAKYSTMRLGGNAKFLCEVTNEAQITEALQFSGDKGLKMHVVGGGSNSIFSDDGFGGLVIVNKVLGVEVEEQQDSTEMTVGAGEKWDDIVAKSVELGYSDIAALSMIPGSAGAAPVQNIGAYGQQISDSLVSVRAYDTKENAFIIILRQSCNFGYRNSKFNTDEKGRYIISSIKLRLNRKKTEQPFFKDVGRHFSAHDIVLDTVTPAQLREAVVDIRTKKLPDPEIVANTGSFFKNPIVDQSTYTDLQVHYPSLKAHKTDDGKLKLYAGQLIELAGMKNYHDKQTGMATWKNQALVLVNETAESTADLLAFKKKIVTSVHAAFGVTLKQEPEFIS